MKKLLTIAACAFAFVAASMASAADLGTPEEASGLVKKAIAFYKENGKDKTLEEVSNKKGRFVDRDLYLSVYDMNGKVLAHGANPRLIGIDGAQIKDADGKEFLKNILAQAKAKGSGTEDYKWPNPVTGTIQAKSAYFEKVGDIIISCGYYKQ